MHVCACVRLDTLCLQIAEGVNEVEIVRYVAAAKDWVRSTGALTSLATLAVHTLAVYTAMAKDATPGDGSVDRVAQVRYRRPKGGGGREFEHLYVCVVVVV